jgi:hypothetical protein
MADFSRLSANWIDWTSIAGMTHVSETTDCTDCQILFKSDDQSFHLRREDDWWAVDEVDDRGRRYNDTARFSTFELAEIYLIWSWASVTRTAIGAKQLGSYLHSQGMEPGVRITPTDREYYVELETSRGSAILPTSNATIFSHLMSKSVEEIEQMVREGVA